MTALRPVKSARLHFGTSSWSEKSWVGVFYPRGIAAGEFLTHYATQFHTVEADVTYYRVPSERMVSNWAARTPEGFILSAKFPRSVVHAGEGRTPDASRLLLPDRVGEEVESFLGAMSRLGPKCGPLVLQFPYFNRNIFPSPGEFCERLDRFLGSLPDAFRYAVELRNRAWLKPELLEILRARRTALVLADLHYMPHPDELPATLDPLTADFLYVRLIGNRKAVEARTGAFDRIVLDRGDRLRRWARYLGRIAERVDHAFLYANNHFAGHGPDTIRQLAELLENLAGTPDFPPSPRGNRRRGA